jgi:hypothetical protein
MSPVAVCMIGSRRVCVYCYAVGVGGLVEQVVGCWMQNMLSVR